MNRLTRFAKDENGNAAIDWIVLTTGIVMLSIAIIATLSSGVGPVSTETAEVADPIPVDNDNALKG